MSTLDAIAGLVVGLTLGTLAGRWLRRRSPTAAALAEDVPITWCGNCGQPTAALCHEHKRQASARQRDR
ncbi:hypothetical protein Cme02nite_36070 [Catellatospora methionotrophica]|uniref:Uncharacterized protein n=1 Tax=Catellatospora methionotrophica TaxID=121620 RepID=A0A8J3LAM3_9ACTN|nr:hypothetical protein [Catellatospora methionotrophica]GIG15275.1 hypothetical protein Cme02nite_36070 [Catellatospora methionotrophica]